MISAPNRPRFRWSLRTMFVVVTVLCCWLGWRHHNLGWIQQQQDLLKKHAQAERHIKIRSGVIRGIPTSAVEAPGHLRLFGEKGFPWVAVFTDEGSTELQ